MDNTQNSIDQRYPQDKRQQWSIDPTDPITHYPIVYDKDHPNPFFHLNYYTYDPKGGELNPESGSLTPDQRAMRQRLFSNPSGKKSTNIGDPGSPWSLRWATDTTSRWNRDFANWRQERMVASPEWEKNERLRKEGIAAANAEAKAKGVTPAQLQEVKKTIKDNIVQNFLENAKPEFARRGSGHQRPKSWGKGIKSGSEKRKMREQGKREAREMNEDLTPEKRRELYHELKHEDTPEFIQSQADAMVRGIMRGLAPIYQKHGITEEDLRYTSDYGFPSLGSFINHPNFEAFTQDFIKHHTALNRQHWKQYGKASSVHWPAILEGKKQLENLAKHRAYLAKNSNLSEGSEELEAELGGKRIPHQIELILKRIKAEKALRAREEASMQESKDWVPPEVGAHPEAERMMLDADDEEAKEKARREDWESRSHITHAEEQEMHDILHRAIFEPARSRFSKAPRYEDFRKGLDELDAHIRGRIHVLSDPTHTHSGKSHEDRLTRIHQLLRMAETIQNSVRKQYFSK